MPAEKLVRVPENLSDDQIGGHMLRALTVQYLLRRLYKVQPGEQVLFHAGAGGLGQIAIQWLKHIGAEVITTVGSEEKAEVVKSLGARSRHQLFHRGFCRSGEGDHEWRRRAGGI